MYINMDRDLKHRIVKDLMNNRIPLEYTHGVYCGGKCKQNLDLKIGLTNIKPLNIITPEGRLGVRFGELTVDAYTNDVIKEDGAVVTFYFSSSDVGIDINKQSYLIYGILTIHEELSLESEKPYMYDDAIRMLASSYRFINKYCDDTTEEYIGWVERCINIVGIYSGYINPYKGI